MEQRTIPPIVEHNKNWKCMSTSQREHWLKQCVDALMVVVKDQGERIQILEKMHPLDENLKKQLDGTESRG